jgi:hypothetical protein
MMYTLTKKEMDDLVPAEQLVARDFALGHARLALLKATKFTCIHDEKRISHRGYCDDCPCGLLKFPSKASDLLCTLSKDYSK